MTIIGIDLGTTNSVIAVLRHGRPVAIPNTAGDLLTPSVVALDYATGQWLVGAAAKPQIVLNPTETVFSIKRLLGRHGDDPALEWDRRFAPYDLMPLPDAREIGVRLGVKWYTPTDLSAVLLRALVKEAEHHLGSPVTQAVIAVPACFNHAQRQATRLAGQRAGLEVVRTVNEPTAAALAYSLRRLPPRTAAICRLGGGTFDVSIVAIKERAVQVKATGGDSHLGGDDFNMHLLAWICETFEAQHGVDLTQNLVTLSRLREAVEILKCQLSTQQVAELHLPDIAPWTGSTHTLHLTLTREHLVELTQGVLARLRPPCEQVLRDAGVAPGDLDEVILSGQQGQMPAVQQTFQDIFGRPPRMAVNTATGVALGAAVQAGIVSAAFGARTPVVEDVIPFSLGIRQAAGTVHVLAPRNTPIPCRKCGQFITVADNQTAMTLRVYGGEQPQAADNVLLGELHLDGLQPAPQGQAAVSVCLEVDGEDLVTVTARDGATGREKQVVIGLEGRVEVLKDLPAAAESRGAAPTTVEKPAAPTHPAVSPHQGAIHWPPPVAGGVSPADASGIPIAISTAAHALLTRAESWLTHPLMAAMPPLQTLLTTSMSALSAAVSQDATAVEQSSQSLTATLECLEALEAADYPRALRLLVERQGREINPQARGAIGQTLRQIGQR